MVSICTSRELWRCDSTCPLGWRAEDAARLAAGKGPTWALDPDLYVVKFADYLRSLDAGARLTTAQQHSAMAVARELAQRTDPLRWEIEARLLAGQTDEAITAITGVMPNVITWFEALFFSVRQSSKAEGYLLMHTVAPGHWIGFRDDELRQFWAWTALAGGPLILDRLIDVFDAVRESGEAPTLGVYLRHGDSVPSKIQSMVAAMVLPSTGTAGAIFGQMHLGLLEADAADDPDRRALLRERVRLHLIRCARAVLAGKPLPQFRRGPAGTAGPVPVNGRPNGNGAVEITMKDAVVPPLHGDAAQDTPGAHGTTEP